MTGRTVATAAPIDVLRTAVADGTLRLAGDWQHPDILAWCPVPHPQPRDGRLQLQLSAAPSVEQVPPDTPATLRWETVSAWVNPHTGALAVHGPAVHATGLFGTGQATLFYDATTTAAALHAALLQCAGLLLAADAQLLMHAGALCDAEGRAWLLVGDSHAGKSTTIATWSAAGRGWVADDTLVLASVGDASIAHAWVRQPHLDIGYAQGAITGVRTTVTLNEAGPFARRRWMPVAPVAGILLPSVAPEAATQLEPTTPAAVLAALVRQSPWLMALPMALATPAMARLTALAALPAHRLVLGRDSYGAPARLAAVLGPVLGPVMGEVGHAAVDG
jgi:hypothetical protein